MKFCLSLQKDETVTTSDGSQADGDNTEAASSSEPEVALGGSKNRLGPKQRAQEELMKMEMSLLKSLTSSLQQPESQQAQKQKLDDMDEYDLFGCMVAKKVRKIESNQARNLAMANIHTVLAETDI